MCFRLLYTLHRCGFVEKAGENQYRLNFEMRPTRRYRIGYAGQGQDSSFPREVLSGLLRAAQEANVELITVDNRYDPRVALRNAAQLAREQVDLVIEFQTDEPVSAAISAIYTKAGIPMIAIDIPHPGATYFGANNYEAGSLAGRHLARWARQQWDGVVEEILLIELGRAGPLPRSRLRGVLAGINEGLRLPDDCRISRLDGDGQFRPTLNLVRKHLRNSASRRILVGAVNDPSALGALYAIEESGRAQDCVVVGQNAEPEARAELRQPRTRLIGSVAFFPEKYGEGLIRLALDLLNRKPTSPAVFTRHLLVTPENVDHLYPNDSLMGFTGVMPARFSQ
jgi:ribose transport system substrate-binding protein